jgi:ABC-type Zn uptake system ZnuABC Zn-binding protein ZnuA
MTGWWALIRLLSPINTTRKWLVMAVIGGLVLMVLAGCQADDGNTGPAAAGLTPLSLPELQPVERVGRPLRVVATTSIIGDVVAQVGGETIDLTVLMLQGQDPHSFQPKAADMAAAAEADVIFVNGWDLEEGLLSNLASAAGDIPMVPVSANIQPLPFGGHEHDDENEDHAADEMGAPDPHTWLDPRLVVQWVANIEQSLQVLDPDHAAEYASRAAGYREDLQQLVDDYDRLLDQLPAERRKLVTNHDALGYFAAAYNFTVIGTVIPGASTIAEPSAGTIVALAQLMSQESVCTIFVETTVNDQLARSVAAEVSNCPAIQVLTLYTGALGPPGSGAESYIGMMRANIEAIIDGLQ